MFKATIVSALLLSSSLFSTAQNNPTLYLRITKCNNIKADAFVNDKQIMSGACKERLSWVPTSFNDALVESKNKLRFALKNETAGEFFGDLTLELLAADNENQSVKKVFTTELKLQDMDRFQTGIDNFLKKAGWKISNAASEPDRDLIVRSNRRDSLDYFFDKQDRFYITITAAKRAVFSIDANGEHILEGNLHISALDDAYALKSYPYFFLNTLDRSAGKTVLSYSLQPQQGKDEAYLEIAIQHYAPRAVDPQIIAISKITCGRDEVKNGEFDITEPLRRHGYFNP